MKHRGFGTTGVKSLLRTALAGSSLAPAKDCINSLFQLATDKIDFLLVIRRDFVRELVL